ncbi:hypothetical protein B0H16DRAFT_1693961 [Mycena metata]|uniref:Uncharacterized protein n=1 Tax=Mycena metata TaxID=1033252 RepID=A0AAD7N1N0_9AGAR|nr:hypothetical protein B0H16DRAFT_1693961 [Mycena metata]
MARILISLVSLVCVYHTLAAPVIARNSTLPASDECLVPNAQISSALSSLSTIIPASDVLKTGPLFAVEQSLFKVTGLTALLAGDEPPHRHAAWQVVQHNSGGYPQGSNRGTRRYDGCPSVSLCILIILGTRLTPARHSASNANSDRTTQTLAKVTTALKQAASSLNKDLTDCPPSASSSASSKGSAAADAVQASAAAATEATILAGGVKELPSGTSFGRR